jgi:hypothetical protein
VTGLRTRLWVSQLFKQAEIPEPLSQWETVATINAVFYFSTFAGQFCFGTASCSYPFSSLYLSLQPPPDLVNYHYIFHMEEKQTCAVLRLMTWRDYMEVVS